MRRDDYLSGLAKDGDSRCVLAQRLKQREWVIRRGAIVGFDVEQREGQWRREQGKQIERERCPDREINSEAIRRAQSIQQEPPLLRFKHLVGPALRGCR